MIHFLDLLFEVATDLKGRNLTHRQQDRIVELYNKKNGTTYNRVKSAIEEVIGKKIPKKHLLVKRASLSNLKNLLSKMEMAIDEWQTPKK